MAEVTARRGAGAHAVAGAAALAAGAKLPAAEAAGVEFEASFAGETASVEETASAPEAPLVRVAGFSFSYEEPDGSLRPVLRDVSFAVKEGAFCVVTGPTGCGKTTLLRSLKPELAPVGVRAGRIEACGQVLLDAPSAEECPYAAADRAKAPSAASAPAFDPRACGHVSAAQAAPLPKAASAASAPDPRIRAAQIGFVMQDPDAQLVCDTVLHELAFGLENLGTPQDEMRRRVAEAAHFFGIEPWLHAACETLSGGQKQIVNLAAALALRPRLLLLDEPTAQLDPNAQSQFIALLARVNRDLGVTVVMSTHAPEDVAGCATCRLELGAPLAPAPCAVACERLRPRWRARAEALAASEPCLVVRGAHFRYGRGEPWVLRGLDLAVRRGSVHAVVGGNGCGKSTLLKLMAGVEKPQRGRVGNALARSQALLPQDPKALLVCDSVAEELAEWRARCGWAPHDERAMLSRFGLDGCETLHPYDLSGGQQQMLALAKLLLTGARLLLLDEPTKGLDPQACADMARTLRALADEGRTAVLVTHDLDFAYVAADEVTMLFDGEAACTEPAEAFFANNLVYRPSAASRLFALID
ncbi:ABC transporter ATP-binding protein [Gordonibacter sp. An230]|uniref:ABC transporter ATP-binding protein n=1 Tax=Gordonibacter sp. An230 TaxID=1965592 RepID=UPI000B37A3BB|nr:ABC transporter ATP-binding protein [Gordonibacter sp. An230]